MSDTQNTTALTQYAHGAGCGCKIAPRVLKEILQSNVLQPSFEKLLVGNSSNDDAAVYDIGDGRSLISTTDFFTPIVDDAYDFGRIAAANAISDVYAMGGTPLMALAILGWPVNKLSPQLAQKVIEGAKSICAEAGIPLAGGHSIDSTEPMFGLSVNGMINTADLKRNNTAEEGDWLFLTKPIGVGILSTAQKKGLLRAEDQSSLIKQLSQLNKIGEKLGKIKGVTAMTDVTGFGLMGHLVEMAEGSGLTAKLDYAAVPKISSLPYYMNQGILPDATFRNWNAYNKIVRFSDTVNAAEAFSLLPDPQTNGGILFSVKENCIEEIFEILKANDLESFSKPIGQMMQRGDKVIEVV